MKNILRLVIVSILVLSMSTVVYSMGAKPEPPVDVEIPAEFNVLGEDITSFALASLGKTIGSDIDIQTLLAGLIDGGYIELGEHKGTTVSLKPCLTDGIMGLTIRLAFENAVVEVPKDPSKPTGEKKEAATITSGTMDLTIGVKMKSIVKQMIVVQINTPETLVLADENLTEVEFQDLTLGYNISKLAPISGEDYAIEGKIIIDGFEVDVETIADLLDLLKNL